MVGADLHLESVGCSGERNGHQAGVVDQHIDARRFIHHVGGGFPDSTQIGKIERDEVMLGPWARRSYPIEGFAARRLIAAGQDDSRAGSRERRRSL